MRIPCFAVLALMACGPAPEGHDGGAGGGGGFGGGAGGGGVACSSSNCAGCCNAGHCEAGTTAFLCGKGGNACVACNAGLVCSAGACSAGDPQLSVTLLYDYIPDGGCDTPTTTEPAHCSQNRSMLKSQFDALALPAGCVASQNFNARTVDCSGGCQFFPGGGSCQYGAWACYWPPDGGQANPLVRDCSWRL